MDPAILRQLFGVSSVDEVPTQVEDNFHFYILPDNMSLGGTLYSPWLKGFAQLTLYLDSLLE